jgi:hypothetical protein
VPSSEGRRDNGDGHVAGAADEIPQPVVMALLRPGRGRHGMIIGRSLTLRNSSRAMGSVRRRGDNSRGKVQNVRGDNSDEESAGVNYSHRSPKGNRQMRRLLNQAANAAVKAKGSTFELVYRRLVPRLGHAQTIGAIAHRLCRLIWKILHQGVRYEERGPAVTKKRAQARAAKMIRELRSVGYRVDLVPSQSSSPA